MTQTTLLTFAVIAFVGIATPGPTVLLALANGPDRLCGGALLALAGSMAFYRRSAG